MAGTLQILVNLRNLTCIPVAALVIAGCKSTPPVVFETWASKSTPFVAESSSGNAFDGYVLAAKATEDVAQEFVSRVSFTPKMREDAMAAVAPAIRTVANATQKPCKFYFVAYGPFEAPPYRRGWRLIGRVLAWRIDFACLNAQWDDAIGAIGIATTFGMDLSGGSVMDATIGWAIVKDARERIVPYLDQLTAQQLTRLSKVTTYALKRRPKSDQVLANEEQNMMVAVQTIQDAFLKHDWEGLSDRLGGNIQPAIDYLKKMSSGELSKAPAYFAGFAAEARTEVQWMERIMNLPAAERKELKHPELAPSRPWQRFARHFFQTGQVFLTELDESLAKMRLLAIEAHVRAQIKVNGAAPKSLAGISPELITDPYSGKSLIYRAEGRDYRLYSVGANLTDNGGLSNASGLEPDLVLQSQ